MMVNYKVITKITQSINNSVVEIIYFKCKRKENVEEWVVKAEGNIKEDNAHCTLLDCFFTIIEQR